MDRFDMLMIILEESLKKNGNQDLTVKHLLNMMKMVSRVEEDICIEMNEFQAECLNPNN